MISNKDFSYRFQNNAVAAEPHQCSCGCGGLCRKTGKPCSHGDQKAGQPGAAAKFKKACMGLLLAADMLFAASAPASAIDFKAQGEWLVGFGAGDGNLVSKTGPKGGQKDRTDSDDIFGAAQRVRLQLDAVASEALSGTVYFEIGDQQWGKGYNDHDGGGLGADGYAVKVKNAYLDWVVPQTDLKFRMGLQAVALPNAAGGSAILDADGAAVTASYKFNDNVGLTAMWVRPLNDNYDGWTDINGREHRDRNYLDNMDLFMLSLPLTFDGIEATPWVMYGMLGKNALEGLDGFYNRHTRADGTRTDWDGEWETPDGNLPLTLTSWHPGLKADPLDGRGKAYASMFWAGLPITLSLWDPLNIEFDINYGYVEGIGRYDVTDNRRDNLGWSDTVKRANTKRSGWLVKALVEYKLDWGVPGIFAWYASGDDGNVKNGSERMPSVAGAGNFTSFIGDGNLSWGTITKGKGGTFDWSMSYAGTWGVGLQLRDMSFIDDLEHTFRVALWGGTNSPSMVRYFNKSSGWNDGYGADGPYLTTHDNLLEFNLVNSYKMYENLELNLELGYVVNMINRGTWDRRWMEDSCQKQDAWKAQLVFAYSF